jgi:hypothetical protein
MRYVSIARGRLLTRGSGSEAEDDVSDVRDGVLGRHV